MWAKLIISILVVSLSMIHKHIPVVGSQYGDWTIVSDQVKGGSKNTPRRFHVRCKCGMEAFRTVGGLTTGQTTQCNDCKRSNHKHPYRDGADQLSGSYFGSIRANAKYNNRVSKFDITKEYVWDLFLHQDKRCKLSNIPITLTHNKVDQTASLDRIDSSKGYIEGNVQWVHKIVNTMKMNMLESEFVFYCQKISENAKEFNS